MRLVDNHPAEPLRIFEVETIIGWIGTEEHAMAYSVLVEDDQVYIFVHKSACQSRPSENLKKFSERAGGKSACQSQVFWNIFKPKVKRDWVALRKGPKLHIKTSDRYEVSSYLLASSFS